MHRAGATWPPIPFTANPVYRKTAGNVLPVRPRVIFFLVLGLAVIISPVTPRIPKRIGSITTPSCHGTAPIAPKFVFRVGAGPRMELG